MVDCVKPVLQALVLAEHVYEDRTGKKIIAGTFDRIGFSKKPPVKEIEQDDGTKQKIVAGGFHAGSPYVYLSLTDVCHNTKLQLKFVNLTKNLVLFGKDLEVDCNDRLATIEIVLPLPPLPISEEATYAFEVACEGEIIGSCRIRAFEIKFA
jgi:hypothetical protein